MNIVHQPALKDPEPSLSEELNLINRELESLGFDDVVTLSKKKRKYSVAQYRKVIPVLLKWLYQVQRYDTRTIIVGALSTRAAKPLAAKPLIDVFYKSGEGQQFSGLKWQLCDALDYVADDTVANELIEIACDKKHGADRIMAVRALGNLSGLRAGEALIALLSDNDVYLGALDGIVKSGYAPARPHLERFLTHNSPYAVRV